MKSQIKTLVATTLCGLSLALIAAPAVHAQDGQPKVLITAKARGKAYVDPVVVDANGSARNGKLAAPVATSFADTEWTVFDNGTLIVTKGGKQVLTSKVFMDDALTFFRLHARTQNLQVEGNMYSFSDDPTKGNVILFVSVPANGGQSWIAYNIWLPLAFTPPQGGGDGGGVFGG